MDSSKRADTFRRLVFNNLYLKLIAVVMTIALYAWVSGDRETVATGYAPVDLNAPEGMVLVSDTTDWVELTLRGQRSILDRFDPSELDPIRIDLGPDDDDSYAHITPAMVGVPPTIRVTRIEPNSIFIELEEERFKTVDIEPAITGSPTSPYVVENVTTSPSVVSIRGPASEVDPLDALATQTIDITDRDQSLRQSVELDIESDFITAELDEPITVEIDIQSEDITRDIEIPVDIVNTSLETSAQPDRAQVTISGSPSTIEELDTDLIRAEIDMSEGGQEPGVYSRHAEVINLPPDAELEHIHPERFRIVLEQPSDDEASP